jgi:hypothetical protein
MTLKSGRLFVKRLMVVSYLFYDDTEEMYIVDEDSLELFYKRLSSKLEIKDIEALILQDKM